MESLLGFLIFLGVIATVSAESFILCLGCIAVTAGLSYIFCKRYCKTTEPEDEL